MKFIFISYPPSFYTRIIPIGRVVEMNTYIEQKTDDINSKCLRVNIELQYEIIFTKFCGDPESFWEHFEEEGDLYLHCFEIDKLSESDKQNIEYADTLFKLKV